jgi:hypothetical protein
VDSGNVGAIGRLEAAIESIRRLAKRGWTCALAVYLLAVASDAGDPLPHDPERVLHEGAHTASRTVISTPIQQA